MGTGHKDWLNSLHPWLQEAAFRILTNKTLSYADYSDLVALIKTPLKLDPAKPREYPSTSSSPSTSNAVRLQAISEIKGIDNLNPKVPLTFGSSNLTVLYGNNGTGKSGYTRILKRACGKPGAVELKPNIYKAAPAAADRSIKISYSVNGTAQSVAWNPSTPAINDLICIDIFDAKSGRVYTDNETEISYIPAELAFLSDLVVACEAVEKVLKAEKETFTKALPQFPPTYAGTAAATIYATISPTTHVDQLAKLHPWTEADAQQKTSLEDRLRIADPANEAKKLRSTKAQIVSIENNLNQATAAMSTSALQDLKQKHKTALEKRKAATEGAKVLAESSELDGIGSETWRTLWQAAREYSSEEAYPFHTFPNTMDDAKCVLCHQILDDTAKQRLNDFEIFITGKIETDAQAAEAALRTATSSLPEAPAETALETAIKAASLSADLAGKVRSAWEEIKKFSDASRATPSPDIISTLSAKPTEAVTELQKLSTATEDAAVKFDNDAKLFDRKKATEELNGLKAKEWTAVQKGAIEAEIERQKNISKYDGYIRTTLTTIISKRAAEISEALITKAYIDRFNSELNKLGAKRISVELVKTRAVKGRTLHQIRLKGVTATAPNPADILSDGELRIVSIAAFLADVTGRATPTPFVFDDPISSLDQSYEDNVAHRMLRCSRGSANCESSKK